MRNIGHAGLGERTGHDEFAQPEPFSIEVRPDRHRVLVVPRGELDLGTVDGLAAEIDALVARGFDRIVVDLRETSFMDSSGVHLLLKCARRIDARITVIDGPPAVARVFDLAGVRAVLPFEDAQ